MTFKNAYLLAFAGCGLILFAGCYPTIGVKQMLRAADHTFDVTEDSSLTENLRFAGQEVRFVLEKNVANGTLVLDGSTGKFDYTPDQDFNGVDEFTYHYQGETRSNTAKVVIDVSPVNDTPVAEPAIVNTNEEQAVTSTLVATDVDTDDTLTWSLTSVPVKGEVTSLDPATGVFTYEPALNETEAENLVFTVTDSEGAEATAGVTINIANVNDAPILSANPTAVTDEDVSVAIPFVTQEFDGDALTFMTVAEPTAGTLQNADVANGTVLYVPNADTFGVDTFSFKVNDGLVDSATVTVEVTVNFVADTTITVDQLSIDPTDVTLRNNGSRNFSASVRVVTRTEQLNPDNSIVFSTQTTIKGNSVDFMWTLVGDVTCGTIAASMFSSVFYEFRAAADGVHTCMIELRPLDDLNQVVTATINVQ